MSDMGSLTKLALVSVACVLAASSKAEIGCKPGEVQVGERRVDEGKVIRVRALCRRIKLETPSSPQQAITINEVTEAREFTVAAPNGQVLTEAQQIERPLLDGTVLQTGSSGRARIKLPNGTQLSLGPNTRVVVEQFSSAIRNTDPKYPEFGLHFVRGYIKYISYHLNKQPRPIRLGWMGGAVRGTEFEIQLDSSGTGSLKLSAGRIDYEPVKGGVMVPLKPGQTIWLKDGNFSRVE